MSRLSPQHAQARRALIDDIHRDKKGWLQHGIAALAVSVLGLGVAGSIMLTGSAQQSTGTVETTTVQTTVQPGVVQPDEFESREKQVTRSSSREALSAAQVAELAKKRADSLTKADAASDKVAQKKATSVREKELASEAAASAKNAKRIKAEKDAAAAAAAAAAKKGTSTQSGTTTTQQDSAPAASTPATTTKSAGNGKASLPITSGYTIAAHFGQVGSWSRYHTGLDFAAPVGTPIHAPTSGTVTNAGSGSASGWAGNYVTIKHADGTSTLYAHMSTVSVSVGQSVTGGQVLGAVGMTGRTFGPHMHFEVYPAGVTPGDVYSAINPQPWLVALGVNP